MWGNLVVSLVFKVFVMTFVYLIHCTAYPMRIKIGISKSPRKRASGLSNKLGKRRVLFCVPVFFAYQTEQTLHRFLSFAAMPVNCNGGTEFFSIFVAPFALVVILFAFALHLVVFLYLLILIFSCVSCLTK